MSRPREGDSVTSGRSRTSSSSRSSERDATQHVTMKKQRSRTAIVQSASNIVAELEEKEAKPKIQEVSPTSTKQRGPENPVDSPVVQPRKSKRQEARPDGSDPRLSSPASSRKSNVSTVPYSPRIIAAMDRTVLELETQTLARKVEILAQENDSLKSSVDLYETRLRSVSIQLKAKQDEVSQQNDSVSQSTLQQIKEERDNARKEAEKLRRDFVERKTQLEKLREQLTTAGKALVTSGQAKDQAYEITISTLQEQLSFAETKHVKAEETVEMMRDNLLRLEAQYKGRLESATAALQAAQTQADCITTEWDKARREAETKVQESFDNKDQIVKLREKLKMSSKENTDLKRYKSKLEEKLAEKDKECEKKLEKLQQQLAAAKKELSDVKTEREQDNEVLCEQVRQAQAKTKEVEAKCESLQELGKSQQELHDQIATLKQDAASAQSRCKKSEVKCAAMKEKLEAAAKKHEEYRVQIFNLKQGLSAVANKEEADSLLAKNELQMVELHSELSAAKEKLQKGEAEVVEMEAKVRTVLAEHEEDKKILSEQKQSINNLTTRIATLTNELSDVRLSSLKEKQEISELRARMDIMARSQAKLSKAEEQEVITVQKLEVMAKQQEESKKRIAELEWGLAEYETLSKKAVEYKSHIENLKAELSSAHSRIKHGAEEVEGLQRKIRHLAEGQEKDKRSLAEQNETIADLTAQISNLDSKARQEMEKRVATLDTELSSALQDLKKEEQRVISLKEEMEAMAQKHAKYESKISSLTSELSAARSGANGGTEEELAALRSKIEEDKKVLDGKQKLIVELTSRLDAFRRTLNDKSDGDRRLKSLMDQLTQSTHRHAHHLAQKENEWKAKFSEQEEYYDELRNQVQTMRDHLEEVERERAALQMELESRGNRLSNHRLEELHNEIRLRDDKIERLEDLLTEAETRGVCIQSEFEYGMQTKDKKLGELEQELRKLRSPVRQTVSLLMAAAVAAIASVYYFGLTSQSFDLEYPLDFASIPPDVISSKCNQIMSLLPFGSNNIETPEAP